jgi:hypothetical protein
MGLGWGCRCLCLAVLAVTWGSPMSEAFLARPPLAPRAVGKARGGAGGMRMVDLPSMELAHALSHGGNPQLVLAQLAGCAVLVGTGKALQGTEAEEEHGYVATDNVIRGPEDGSQS